MPSEFSIKVGLVLIPVEPDGGLCVVCEETIYLKAWHYATVINGSEPQPVGNTICDSCKEALT